MVSDPAEFIGAAEFDGAEFRSAARFDGTKFRQVTRFDGVQFCRDAEFDVARFDEQVTFFEVEFQGRANFDGASLGDESRLGPCRAQELRLNRVRFGEGMLVQCRVEEIAAQQMHCSRDGLSLQLGGILDVDASKVYSTTVLSFSCRDGNLTVAGAVFGAPATIAVPDRSEAPASDSEGHRVPRLLRPCPTW